MLSELFHFFTKWLLREGCFNDRKRKWEEARGGRCTGRCWIRWLPGAQNSTGTSGGRLRNSKSPKWTNHALLAGTRRKKPFSYCYVSMQPPGWSNRFVVTISPMWRHKGLITMAFQHTLLQNTPDRFRASFPSFRPDRQRVLFFQPFR